MMIRRPRAGDTEEDLLAFQEEFLASGTRSSARVATSTAARPGEKRTQASRDVVNLLPTTTIKQHEDGCIDQHPCPPQKFSKFRETSRESEEDPHQLMERNDQHITKILADIQEREVSGIAADTFLPVQQAIHGFPTVHKIRLQDQANRDPKAKKKSLFARQFESSSLEAFGLVGATPRAQPVAMAPVKRDRVDPPVSLQVREVKRDEESRIAIDQQESMDIDQRHGSSSAGAWDQFLFRSTLVSGQGLLTGGVTTETARQEVENIHEENMKKLSAMSQEEIAQERDKIANLLGPDIVAFIKKQQPVVPKNSTAEEPSVDMRERDAESASVRKLAVGNKWLHMDVVEKEKMEWMSDVPVIKNPPNAVREVRFSLDGLVILRDTGLSIPSHLGLHHHGDDPAEAGYTLSELYMLSRSSLLQQRVLGIQVLGAICKRAHHNEYKTLIEGDTPMISVLLKSGLPLLLRYSLDDSSDALQAASVQCLHSLLVSPADDSFVEDYSDSFAGLLLPSLSPSRDTEDKEEEEASDEKMVEQDIVKGLLQMSILPRLRYLLEVCHTPSPTVVIELVTRLARHSLQAASQVVHCPRLMSVVLDMFLPATWSSSSGEYNRPLPAALKLLVTLCSAGRHLAKHLLAACGLMDVIVRHSVPSPSDYDLPESHSLCTQAMRVWTVLLRYGLATETFCDVFPSLLSKLHLMLKPSLFTQNHCQLKTQSSLIRLLEASIHTAAVTPDMLTTNNERDTIPPPAVTWDHVRGVVSPALLCLSNWLREAKNASEQDITLDRVVCISSLLQLVSSYFTELYSKPRLVSSPVDTLQMVEEVSGLIASMLTESKLYTFSISTIQSSLEALLLCQLDESPLLHWFPKTASKAAQFAGDNMKQADYTAMKHLFSVLATFSDLLLGCGQLCLSLIQLHKGVTSKLLPVIENLFSSQYLQTFTQLPQQFGGFVCLIPLFIHVHTLLHLFVILSQNGGAGFNGGRVQLFHCCAFKLISLVPPGLEHIIHSLLSTILFNSCFYREVTADSLMEHDVRSLSVTEMPIQITSDSAASIPPSSLLTTAHSKLPLMRDVYLEILRQSCLSVKSIEQSRRLLFSTNPMSLQTLLLSPSTAAVIPSDWMFLPVKISRTPAAKVTISPQDATYSSAVTEMLYLVVLLEQVYPETLVGVSLGERLAGIMSVFLIDSDLFLDKLVYQCLSVLLKHYCQPSLQQSLVLPTASVMGSPSFHDFYSDLLIQYAAVSYGDQLFSSYLILPLQQRFSSQLRRLFWNDHPTSLRSFTLTPTQVPFGLSSLLYPVESDTDLLNLYMSCLAQEIINNHRNPLLFLLAVHHIHCHVFQHSESPESLSGSRKKFLTGILNLRDKVIQRHLLYYTFSPQSPSGYQLASSLTDTQQHLILSITQQLPQL